MKNPTEMMGFVSNLGRHFCRPVLWIVIFLLVPDVTRRNQPSIHLDEQCAVTVCQIHDDVLDAQRGLQ